MFGYCFNHLSSIVFPWHISPTTSLSKYSDSYILKSSITAYLGRLVGFCFFHHDLYHDDSACDDFSQQIIHHWDYSQPLVFKIHLILLSSLILQYLWLF